MAYVLSIRVQSVEFYNVPYVELYPNCMVPDSKKRVRSSTNFYTSSKKQVPARIVASSGVKHSNVACQTQHHDACCVFTSLTVAEGTTHVFEARHSLLHDHQRCVLATSHCDPLRR